MRGGSDIAKSKSMMIKADSQHREAPARCAFNFCYHLPFKVENWDHSRTLQHIRHPWPPETLRSIPCRGRRAPGGVRHLKISPPILLQWRKRSQRRGKSKSVLLQSVSQPPVSLSYAETTFLKHPQHAAALANSPAGDNPYHRPDA
jgi:hypothetical protein